MPSRKTVVITFGYRHGEPPIADYTVDVRDVDETDPEQWDREAQAIVDAIEPGSVVAIGCEHGMDRSVDIANRVQKYMDNVVVVDRDLSPDGYKE
jgi:RNase adaptor protein for sRNA GlmZ degradation